MRGPVFFSWAPFWCLNPQLNNGADTALTILSTACCGLLVQPQIMPEPLRCHCTKHNETSTRSHGRGSSIRRSSISSYSLFSRFLRPCCIAG
ncbi:hypothetical protein BDP55DRAFT_288562 [Colletotrichum godetiae]|uniref:Uncharacterized protein n=1 Tax=Colletotrichum godetiae TaxID=1209918 RepID=A0AAJ0AFZ1_9PEZI|nr:uncharacterized protein BDP55DRAFT_288562 [Colletotrichum godetiae]KAK1671627.1 hypothetical protein BDP55DRAFT_288562 [Colletotrichum godetiae]